MIITIIISSSVNPDSAPFLAFYHLPILILRAVKPVPAISYRRRTRSARPRSPRIRIILHRAQAPTRGSGHRIDRNLAQGSESSLPVIDTFYQCSRSG